MLGVFFNPYPGLLADYESGKANLLSTAKTYRGLLTNWKVEANDSEGGDSIKHYFLAQDRQGARYTPSSYIREYSGRDREIVKHFLIRFSMGSRVKVEDLSVCEDWVLSGFNFSAPILEYALRNDGIAITISDDSDWKTDFFYFVDQPNELPNIHGQDDYSPIQDWLIYWSRRNITFKSLLEQNFNILFCEGSINTCFPSRHEEEGVINALKRAIISGYEVDNNLIKSFQTKYGNIFELRSYGDGIRLFFTIENSRAIVGGFYRKSTGLSQNKAGEYAAKRLRDQNHI